MEFLHNDGILDDYYYLGYDKRSYKTVDSLRRHLVSLLEGRGANVACDVESPSISDNRVLGIGLATSATDSFYFPSYSSLYDLAMLVMQAPHITKVFHNALFDMKALMDSSNIVPSPVYDTMQAIKQHGLVGKLQTLAGGLGLEVDDIPDVLAEHGVKRVDELPPDVVAEKCCWDVIATWKVYEVVDPETPHDLIIRDGEIQRILLGMTKRGIKINSDKAAELRAPFVDRIEEIRTICDDAYEFNPGSRQQVAYVLNMEGVHLKLKRPKRGQTWADVSKVAYVADKEALEAVAHLSHWVPLILEYRKLTKADGTYLRPYLDIDRIHPTYNMQPKTGRLASRNPSVMNLPYEYRGIYIPDSPLWTRFDYSQQEIRILAFLSGDRNMQDVFDRGGDFHQETADTMHCDRDDGKTTTFTTIYGGGLATIASRSNSSISDAANLVRQWRFTYPDAWEWMEAQKVIGARQGYAETVLGRRLWLPDEEDDLDFEGRERKFVNYPIQGTGVEILKYAMIECDKVGMDMRIPCHDELLSDGAVMKKPNCENMIPGLYTPFDMTYHKAWGSNKVRV